MSLPRTPAPTTAGEEGKGKGQRRMSHVIFEPAVVRRAMSVRGLTIRQVAMDSGVSPQSVRRAIDCLPMRSDTAKAVWDAILAHRAAAEGFAEAVRMEATG